MNRGMISVKFQLVVLVAAFGGSSYSCAEKAEKTSSARAGQRSKIQDLSSIYLYPALAAYIAVGFMRLAWTQLQRLSRTTAAREPPLSLAEWSRFLRLTESDPRLRRGVLALGLTNPLGLADVARRLVMSNLSSKQFVAYQQAPTAPTHRFLFLGCLAVASTPQPC